MSIDEYITRFTNNAEYERTHGNLQGCLEFRQLAEWLKELKKYKAERNNNTDNNWYNEDDNKLFLSAYYGTL